EDVAGEPHADRKVVGAARRAHHVERGSADQAPAALGAFRADGFDPGGGGAAEFLSRLGGGFVGDGRGLGGGGVLGAGGGVCSGVVAAFLVLFRPVCDVGPAVSDR